MGVEGYTALNVLDINTGKFLSFVDLRGFTNKEIEVCTLYNNHILMMDRYGYGYMAINAHSY